MSEEELRDQLYDATEKFYETISSNDDINLMDELSSFIHNLMDLQSARRVTEIKEAQMKISKEINDIMNWRK